MPPRSKEVLAIARRDLQAPLRQLGLRSTGGQEWAGPLASGTLRLRVQMSKWNGSRSRDGFEFTWELDLHLPEAVAGGRLFELLCEGQREEHRQIQNLVIAKLPLDESELDGLPAYWQAERLARVAPRLAPYPQNEDIWFRYIDADDVRRWMAFIGRALPEAVDRLARGASSVDEAALAADRVRAAAIGNPFGADEGDVQAADDAMRRLGRRSLSS